MGICDIGSACLCASLNFMGVDIMLSLMDLVCLLAGEDSSPLLTKTGVFLCWLD